MWSTEFFKAIRNTFIRKNAIIEPESDMEVIYEPEAPWKWMNHQNIRTKGDIR